MSSDDESSENGDEDSAERGGHDEGLEQPVSGRGRTRQLGAHQASDAPITSGSGRATT